LRPAGHLASEGDALDLWQFAIPPRGCVTARKHRSQWVAGLARREGVEKEASLLLTRAIAEELFASLETLELLERTALLDEGSGTQRDYSGASPEAVAAIHPPPTTSNSATPTRQPNTPSPASTSKRVDATGTA
jgi:hypothetical protein